MHNKQSVFTLCLSLLIISFLMLVISSCTTVEEPETITNTSAGEKIPKDSLEDPSREVYHFTVSCYDMALSANGKLTITEKGGGRNTITVFPDTSLSLRAVQYGAFKEDLILICQLNKGSEDWCEITRINPANRKIKWKSRFGRFNLSTAAIQGDYLYGSTIGYVCKIDLRKGKTVWQQDDLWEEYQVNSFKKILIFKDTVAFFGQIYTLSDKKTMALKNMTFKYNKNSGEEIVEE